MKHARMPAVSAAPATIAEPAAAPEGESEAQGLRNCSDFFRFHQDCPVPACRRAGRCLGEPRPQPQFAGWVAPPCIAAVLDVLTLGQWYRLRDVVHEGEELLAKIEARNAKLRQRDIERRRRLKKE